MKYHNLVYCKHPMYDRRAYLYELPIDMDVKVGDKLCVRDRRGEHIVTAQYENFLASERPAQMFCEANGGYYPPAKVIGTVSTVTVKQDMVNKFPEYKEEEQPWF